MTEISHHSQNERPDINKIWLRNVVIKGKYSPAKFANFLAYILYFHYAIRFSCAQYTNFAGLYFSVIYKI